MLGHWISNRKGNQNARTQKTHQVSQKMVILSRGCCTSPQSHYGYELLPIPVLKKKPSAALENGSFQPKCLE